MMESLEQAFQRIEQEKKSKKLAQWQEIQTKAPQLARDLQALNKVFGRVTLKSVEFKQQQECK